MNNTSIVKYYLSRNAYVYPSSNADDGGEDNTEYNLKTMTDKLAVKSFIIMRPGKYEDYFNIKVLDASDDSQVLTVTSGECCIGGYYCSLGNIEVKVNSIEDAKDLKPGTKYNIIIQLYKDSSNNVRGDGTSVIDGSRECRGVALVLVTDEVLKDLSTSDYLLLGDVTTDGRSRLKVNSITYNIFRYSFLNIDMIITNNDMKIEDWVLYNLRHLNQLSYYKNESDETPRATLTLSSENGKDTFVYQITGTNIKYDITDIENRTHVAPLRGRTELRTPSIVDTDLSTYNGESLLIARSDHHHDGRYVIRNEESAVTQTIKTPVVLTKNVTVDSLIANKNSTFNQNLNVKGALTSPKIKASTSLISEGVLDVAGSSSLKGNVSVGGHATIGSTSIPTDLTMYRNLNVEGLSGSINVRGGDIRVVPQAGTTKGTISIDNPEDSKNPYIKLWTDVATHANKKGHIDITGNLTAGGEVRASKVYNAVWNDYAELYLKKDPDRPSIPGTVICKTSGKLTYEPSTKKNRRLVVGVVTDTYGHILGGDEDKSLEDNLLTHYAVAVSGRVRVKVKPGVFVKEGDLLCADDKGYATVKRFFTRGTVIGKALESGKGKVLVQVMLN